MKDINIYTNEEKDIHQPTIFEFYTDEELGIETTEADDIIVEEKVFD